MAPRAFVRGLSRLETVALWPSLLYRAFNCGRSVRNRLQSKGNVWRSIASVPDGLPGWSCYRPSSQLSAIWSTESRCI